MNLSARDRRALLILASVAVPGLIWLLWPSSEEQVKPAAAAAASTPAGLEQQLQRLRNKEAQIPAKEALAKDLKGQLDEREKGLIIADTLPQAQAALAQLVRQTARQEGFDLRNVSISQPAVFGGEYGMIGVQIGAECRIEQVVNFLTDLTKRPELVSTEELRITLANPKEKTLQFSANISGLVPKKLVPEKKPGIL